MDNDPGRHLNESLLNFVHRHLTFFHQCLCLSKLKKTYHFDSLIQVFEPPPGHASPLSLQCISMVNRSWACLTWCHIPYISDSSWLLARDFCWGIMEDGVQVSWGHLWRCYVDYDWFERAPFEGASVPSAAGAQTWKTESQFSDKSKMSSKGRSESARGRRWSGSLLKTYLASNHGSV